MSFTSEMKEKVSLKEIVERKTSLTEIGKGRWRGLSPFSTEKTPSFYVDERYKIWKCFSTNKSGGIIDYFVESEGFSREEAVEYIASTYSIDLPNKETSHENTKLRECLEEAHKFYRKGRNKALEYIKERGYPEAIVDKYEMGFAPDSYFDLIKHLKDKGFSDDLIVSSGAGMLDTKGTKKVFARQRNRVVIPAKDKFGKLVGFIGRTVVPDLKPKYLNPTNSPLFSRDTTLWNLSEARSKIKDQNKVLICEGPFDAILASEAGLPAVGILGAHISEEQLSVLSKMSQNIYLTFDTDNAGRLALLSTFKQLEELGLDTITYAISLPEGKDIADLVRLRGAEYVNKLIEDAVPDNAVVVSALYEEAKKTSTKESAIARKVLESAKPYVQQTSYSYRSLDLLSRLSQLLNLDKGKLDKYFSTGTDFKHNSQVYKKLEAITFPAPIYERRIMTECLKTPSNIKKLKSMGVTRYDIESYLVAKVLSVVDSCGEDPFPALENELTSEEYATVMSAYMNAEQVDLDIYELGSIIVANKSKVHGVASSVTNILGRPRTNLEKELVPTYKQLLQKVKNGHK